MATSPLQAKKYKPQFSGHETFPLKYGWLKKAFDRVSETEHIQNNKDACWGEDAIARFGVGKNMVVAIKHWAVATGIILENTKTWHSSTTELGQLIFGPEGLDKYMENPSTLWLIHWSLAANPQKTTWFWAFNHYSVTDFDRIDLETKLLQLAKNLDWSPVARKTLKNDVSCFIRTYAPKVSNVKMGYDDALESPLIELGLVKNASHRDSFRFSRGAKPTLGAGIFAHCLIRFWMNYSDSATLSFEAICHEPGSPGRLFLLDENDVIDMLTEIESSTDGVLAWSETAGLKQVVRSSKLTFEHALTCLKSDHFKNKSRKVA